jgi:hypothetical protein
MRIQQFIGRLMGATVAPVAFVGSLIRRNPSLHPDGIVHRAEVKPIAQGGVLGLLAQRLGGTALVRLSGALREWPQGKRGPDLLGVAIRFRSHEEATPRSLPGAGDLLFATASSMPALIIAPFRTNVNDFLANEYYTLLPFELEGAGKVYLRLVPTQGAPAGADRRERLALAVAQRKAVLHLEIQVKDAGEQWLPVAVIDLRERLDLEDGALAFDPSSPPTGLVPSGVLQWLRPAAYAASHLGWRLIRRGSSRASAREVGRMGSRSVEGELERR